MPPESFEEVWRLLHKLEGKPINTLGLNRRNRIVKFLPDRMIRETQTNDGNSWKEPTTVPKRAFRAIWQELTTTGVCEIQNSKGWYLAAACLVEVAELGVGLKELKPLTISLKNAQNISKIKTEMSTGDEENEEFGDLDRIVVDPEICSGKPTIRGTRIMVSNILGMFAGGYSINRILKSYPQLSRLDVISAVEYASRVVNGEKMDGQS